MSKFKQAVPTEWTKVEEVQVNDQLLDISFSDGGSIRFARHTAKGLEFGAVRMNGEQLEMMIKLAQDGTLQRVSDAFQASKDDILAAKEIRDEKRKLVAQEERALSKASLQAQAALEAVNRLQQQIAARNVKKSA